MKAAQKDILSSGHLRCGCSGYWTGNIPESRDRAAGGGFRRSYWRGGQGPSCVLQTTYLTGKAGVFTASKQFWKLWLLLFVGEIHTVSLCRFSQFYLLLLFTFPVPYFVLRLQSFLKIFISGFMNFMLHYVKGKMMLVILLILMTGFISWFGWL